MKNRFLASIVWLGVSVGVLAQTDTIVGTVHQLEGVTITESRRHDVLTSTSPLHIVERADFSTMGIADMADALHRLPGITLRDYGGSGGMKTVSVRGFGAKHTGVSYDGVLLSECQSGEIDLSRYSIDNVDELSLTIGDNDDIFVPARQAAVPAVISIRTLSQPADDRRMHLRAQMKVGSFGLASPFLRYNQRLTDRLTVSVLGEYTYAENDYPYTIRNLTQTVSDRRTNSRMNQGHAEIGVQWQPTGTSMLSGKIYYYDNSRQLPGMVHYYTTLSGETLRDRNAFGQLSLQKRWGERLSMKVHAKYNWAASIYRDRLYSGGVNDASYWQREAYTSAALLYVPARRWALDYSVDYAFNNLNGSSHRTVVGHPLRHSILQSATAKYSSRRLTVQARLLYSLFMNRSSEGRTARDMRRLSPSLSLSLRLLENASLYLRASYKNIFRVPTFNENYYYHYGSYDLLPESTHQWNVGLTYRTQEHRRTELTVTADGYYNKVTDMIVAVPQNMFVWTCVNVGRVRVMGFDTTLRAVCHLGQRHRLTAMANYSYQRVENTTDATSPYYRNQIAYQPEHTAAASLGYENPWVNVSVHGMGMSSRWANNEHYAGTRIDGFADCGLTFWRAMRWRGQQLEARVDVRNVLDRQYEIVYHYPMPGRNIQVSINYNF